MQSTSAAGVVLGVPEVFEPENVALVDPALTCLTCGRLFFLKIKLYGIMGLVSVLESMTMITMKLLVEQQ